MANEDKGRVTCPFCSGTAPVRRNAKGKLYFNCSNCGLVQPALGRFQSWMMDNAAIYGPEGAPDDSAPPPVEVKKETPPVAPPPAPAPAPAKPAGGWGLL